MASQVILTSELITWRGTPGVGDFMWALNSAHKHVADNNLDKVNLEFHWEHGEDYYHHFEDPETIIERLKYIHNFYHQKEKVMVHHIFNSTGRPRTWKRLFTQSDWDTAIQLLRDKGFECHEISYRTPVSEAMYLISTSRLVLCYDGIWHYIAKNFQRPLAVISSEGVTKYHTPDALRLRTEVSYADKSVWWWLEHIEVLLGHTKRKAVNFEKRVRKYYGND